VDYVINSLSWLKDAPQVFLLNVQWKLATGNVKLFISQDTINDYYREQGMEALTPACQKLDGAGLAYSYHISVGTPAEGIVQYAEEQQVDLIVVGARGHETLSSLLLGTVADKVAKLASVPVVLIK
jgi:nucleotide-binding universal stress UspA family protein